MPGFSLTVLLLPRAGESTTRSASEILSLLDDTPDTPGWKWSSHAPPPDFSSSAPTPQQTTAPPSGTRRKQAASDPAGFVSAIKHAASALIAAEPELTRLDSIVGDGDCGLTLKAGAEHILRGVEQGQIKGDDVIGSVANIARIVGDSMDGTGGALYSIFFSALAQGLHDSTGATSSLTPGAWSEALRTAYAKLLTYTRARPPSRTLVDPLAAFVQELGQGKDLKTAVDKAAEAAENTKNLEAGAGRAAYVEREKVKGIVDPGAQGVRVILEALART